MRRSTKALGFASAAIAVVAVWLVDPFGWFARSPPGEGARFLGRAGVAAEERGTTTLRPPSLEPSQREASLPEPRPSVDSAGTERAVLRLVNGEGEPQRGTMVLVARDDELLLYDQTDESGEVALEPDGEQAQFVARSRNRPMAVWTLVLRGGIQVLPLPEGARVAGRLEREDGGALDGIRISLDSNRPLLPADPIPAVVWTAIGIQPSQAVVLAIEAQADGSFEFCGLPASWTGGIRLGNGWRVRSASHGALQPQTDGVRLEAPVEDLLLVLASRAELRGRLLTKNDSTPLAGAMLCATLQASDDDEPDRYGVQSDDEGRFRILSARAAIYSFDLRLGSTREQSIPLLALEGAAVPLDGDLGDLFVDRIRDVRFLLHERDGAPIQGGFAQAGGLRSAPTGRDGRSVLRWVPDSVHRLWAEAPKFVPNEVELGPVVPDPLSIQLERACALEVHLKALEGGSLDQFKVVVRREEGVAAGPLRDQREQASYVGKWAWPTSDLWSAPKASFLVAEAEEPSGVATFHALALGVPLELEVRGLTGPEVYHRQTLEPFHAGETRRIEIALGDGLIVFRGRVVGPAGEPLARATVQIDGAILGWTDEHGEFLYFLTSSGPGTLVVQHDSCSTLFLHDYVVPAGGQAVELRLRPARSVTIEVVDESGAPVPEAEVWILQEGFTCNTLRRGANRHLAMGLTDNVFQIETRVGGRKYVQDHAPDQPQARVVVPAHGSVRARVASTTTSSRAGKIQLVLQPVEGQDGEALMASQTSQPDLALEIRAVLPGSYQASLQYVPTDDERAAGWQEERSVPVAIIVQSKQRTEIQLAL